METDLYPLAQYAISGPPLTLQLSVQIKLFLLEKKKKSIFSLTTHLSIIYSFLYVFFISSDVVHPLWIVDPLLSALSFKWTVLHAACVLSISRS